MADPLGVKQRRTRFIKEYLRDKNATRAAIAAGYSEKGAAVTGTRLLRNAKIRGQIEKEFSKTCEKLDVSVERVTLELARLAFFDPLAFWNEDGTAKPLHEIDPDARRAIAGLEVAELFEGSGKDRSAVGYLKKFKLADKGANLERLGRHLQMFPTKVEVDHRLEIHKVEDGDIQREIESICARLGLAGEADAAAEAGVAQARAAEARHTT